MHATSERNALHLQKKTARGGKAEGGEGLRETREMSSILRDKSPALPSTACPWSSLCNRPHAGSKSVTHRPWGACAGAHHRRRDYKAPDHREVKTAVFFFFFLWERELKRQRLKRLLSISPGCYGYLTLPVCLPGRRMIRGCFLFLSGLLIR